MGFCCCLVVKSCLTLCHPMDCSLPGSSVLGISPGKNAGMGSHFLLQGIFPWPRDWIHVSCIGRWVLSHWGSPGMWVSWEKHFWGHLAACLSISLLIPSFFPPSLPPSLHSQTECLTGSGGMWRQWRVCVPPGSILSDGEQAGIGDGLSAGGCIHGHVCGCNRNRGLPEEEGRSRYRKRRKARINPLVMDSN